MKQIKTICDLNPLENLYPYCLRCERTGESLDRDKLIQRFGDSAPLELVKGFVVCGKCGKKDQIILSIISNEELPDLV